MLSFGPFRCSPLFGILLTPNDKPPTPIPHHPSHSPPPPPAPHLHTQLKNPVTLYEWIMAEDTK